MQQEIEKCIWFNWQEKNFENIKDKRIYFGHETCEKLLPNFEDISHILDFSKKNVVKLTFVTPFLSENGINKVMKFLYKLQNEIETFEVVVSDWGLLDWICNKRIGTPIISRFLIGQQVDYRLFNLLSNSLAEDKFISVDNIIYRLKQKPISDELKVYISSCSLLNKNIIDFFNNIGIYRFEISNVFQSIKLINTDHNSYSLHVPLVPLSIMRWCPNKKENFNFINKNCTPQNCNKKKSKWQTSNDNFNILCMDNGLYYINNVWESKLIENPNIDRVVFNNIEFNCL